MFLIFDENPWVNIEIKLITTKPSLTISKYPRINNKKKI
jgi:hypothetical protein